VARRRRAAGQNRLLARDGDQDGRNARGRGAGVRGDGEELRRDVGANAVGRVGLGGGDVGRKRKAGLGHGYTPIKGRDKLYQEKPSFAHAIDGRVGQQHFAVA